nr:methyltransferase [bacterium]
CIDEWHEHVPLEMVMYHDDWANKKAMFLAPEIWREFIKPLQQEISDRFHDYGIYYMHHSDCKCDAVAQDMVDIGVDMWQGALPQNDLVKVQKETHPQLCMIGGLDGAKIDVAGITEEEIRAEVRRSFDDYCKNGYFFPSNPFGLVFEHQNVFDIAMDEHIKYGRILAERHRAGDFD